MITNSISRIKLFVTGCQQFDLSSQINKIINQYSLRSYCENCRGRHKENRRYMNYVSYGVNIYQKILL